MASIVTTFLATLAGVILFIDIQDWFDTRDTILRRLYETDRDFWIEIGRPRGRLWHPKNEASSPVVGSDRAVWQAILQRDLDPESQAALTKQRVIAKRILARDLPIVAVVAVICVSIFNA